jgi:hypothetical protein
MSYLKVVAIGLAAGVLVVAQGKNEPVKEKRPVLQKVEAPAKVVGNEKTVGAAPAKNTVKSVEKSSTVGNAQTVGGAPDHSTYEGPDGVGEVGNSRTVGER